MDNGGSCSWRTLLSFLQLDCPPGCVPNDYFRFERLHWTILFEQRAGCHAVRAGAFQSSPVVVSDTCEVENIIQCPNATSPPHPMATAFGSIGAESSEWARDLCPTGLVSTGGKSSVKVTAVSTVRGSTLLLLMPPIPR